MSDFLKAFRRQQAEAQQMFKTLAKLYPGAFDKNGKPLVATLRLPSTKQQEQTR